MKEQRVTVHTISLLTFILVTVFTHSASARSINDAVGTTSFTWLKAISDAEISAAGECLAARDGISGLFVHPAAVAGIQNGQMKLSYVSHYVDTQYGSVGYAHRIKEHDVGIRLSYVNYGEFIRTNRDGERTGTFTAGDMGVSLNLGKQPRDDLKFGVAVSYLTSKIDDFTAQAVTIDMGIIYYPPFEGFTVGTVLSNVGKVTKGYSSGHEDILPVILSVGIKKKLAHAPLTLYSDILFPNDNDITYAFGIEAAIANTLFLYAGTKSRNDIDVTTRKAETDYSGVKTFGIGLTINRYRFNYAYSPDEVFNDIHKITISIPAL